MTYSIDLDLKCDRTDDAQFVDQVAQIIRGATIRHRPRNVHVFKIDHWFDHKWLGFSGKVVGAVGSWRKELTVPPFVANRIVDRWHYLIDESAAQFHTKPSDRLIHHCGSSQENLRRRVQDVAPNSAIFWYSGDTSNTARGSLMGYIPVENDYWTWFLAFELRSGREWQIARRKSIHEYEVRLFREAGQKSQLDLQDAATNA